MIAVVPPTATDSPYLVICKRYAVPSITWENLVDWGAILPEAQDFLVGCLRGDIGCSILITGNVFSGKGAVARLMAKSILEHRRVMWLPVRMTCW